MIIKVCRVKGDVGELLLESFEGLNARSNGFDEI